MFCKVWFEQVGGSPALYKIKPPARVAELVDAVVSNTTGGNTLPVRVRPRVRFYCELTISAITLLQTIKAPG